MNYKTIMIVLAICLIATALNVVIHSEIINQDKEIRKEAYEMVNERCASNPDAVNDFQTKYNLTQWKKTN